MYNAPHVCLAAMQDGRHIQVGGACSHDGAHALWKVLDGDLIGPHGLGKRYHVIDGQAVRFYRMRQVERLIPETASPGCVTNLDAEFGAVTTVDLRKVGKRVSL